MAEDEMPPQPSQVRIDLGSGEEVGVFADFVSLWNTPSTLVLDFVVLKAPPQGAPGQPADSIDGRVASRVRLPAEQIYPFIDALRQQGEAWLAATGRSEPPNAWFTPPAPTLGTDAPPSSDQTQPEESHDPDSA